MPPLSELDPNATNRQDNIFINPDASFEIKYNCNQIRTRINTFINNGGMKVGEFQEKLQVSPQSYISFMRQKGPHAGVNNGTYAAAHQFFVAREHAGLKIPRAKRASGAKTTTSTTEDRFAITPDTPRISGEDEGTVPVFDTCDDVRNKINAYLRRDGTTQAALARELSKCVPGAETVSSKNVGDFLRKRGRMAGNTSRAFYAAYVYFEKLRLAENKPKSKKRQEMEDQHGATGVHLENDMGPNAKYRLFRGERAAVNKYGRLEISSRGGGYARLY